MMALLFEQHEDPVSDIGRKKPRRKPAATVTTPEPEATAPQVVVEARRAQILGRIDAGHPCERCHAEAFDIAEEAGREWLVECAFCGQREWRRAIADYLKPKEQGFVFRDGRFAGKAIEEAAGLPRGRDYIEWAAKEHSRPSVREACQKFLLTALPVGG